MKCVPSAKATCRGGRCIFRGVGIGLSSAAASRGAGGDRGDLGSPDEPRDRSGRRTCLWKKVSHQRFALPSSSHNVSCVASVAGVMHDIVSMPRDFRRWTSAHAKKRMSS